MTANVWYADICLLLCVMLWLFIRYLQFSELRKLCEKSANHIINLFKLVHRICQSQIIRLHTNGICSAIFTSPVYFRCLSAQCYITISLGSDVHSRPLTREDWGRLPVLLPPLSTGSPPPCPGRRCWCRDHQGSSPDCQQQQVTEDTEWAAALCSILLV